MPFLSFRASFAAEVPVKILQAYFCTGDPFWSLELDDHENNAILKGSVIMAHFLICHDHAYKELPDYRSKLLKEAIDTTSWLLTADLTETKACVNEKLSCIVYEHICGSNKLWNFREMLKFFVQSTRYLPGQWKTARSVVNALLEGQHVDLILALVEPFCPDSSTHCGREKRRKRSLEHLIGLDSFEAIESKRDVTSKERIRKRAVDPLQMMSLFNRMLCNEEIIVEIAGYYQENYKTLMYNRVWPMKNLSAIWCCLAENLKELYRSTP